MKKTALIVGMAKSGISSAKLLYRNGYNVIINDMNPSFPGLRKPFPALNTPTNSAKLPKHFWTEWT